MRAASGLLLCGACLAFLGYCLREGAKEREDPATAPAVMGWEGAAVPSDSASEADFAGEVIITALESEAAALPWGGGPARVPGIPTGNLQSAAVVPFRQDADETPRRIANR
ncbi:MAG: hypothetical protein KAY32_00310 [Candidatus Eisenbacteria sp.]|nr:hypothetical protein [Candidatus Eisenbacteria bacterium]